VYSALITLSSSWKYAIDSFKFSVALFMKVICTKPIAAAAPDKPTPHYLESGGEAAE
jgi:hypothetical protein